MKTNFINSDEFMENQSPFEQNCREFSVTSLKEELAIR